MPPKKKDNKKQPKSKDGERVEVDPGQYKKRLKLLKSTKTPKLLEGINSCYDHNFIRDGGALAPLMNVFHAKKVGPEVIKEAIMALSDFCDPPKVEGELKFSSNGLLLINKKSSSFKGLQRISNLLQHTDSLIVQNAIRTIYGVTKSFNENGSKSSDEAIYKAKLMDEEALLTKVINSIINISDGEEDDLAAIKRGTELYGNLAISQLLRANIGNNEAQLVLNIIPQIVSTLQSTVREDGEDGEETTVGVVPAKPYEKTSAELYLLSKAAWSVEGQIRLASNGALNCLVNIIDKISEKIETVDFSLPSDDTVVELNNVLQNLAVASEAYVRVAKCCFTSNDERLADLLSLVEVSNNDVQEEEMQGNNVGLGTGKTKLMVCMENGAKSIATAWNCLAKKNYPGSTSYVSAILKVIGTLTTCSEEYSEALKVIICSNGCLPSLYQVLLNDEKNAASAEKVIMGLIGYSFGDRKGTFDGRVCGGDNETAWLSPTLIINTLDEAFEKPERVTFVSRAIRILSCLTQNMENAMALGQVPGASLVPKLLTLIGKINDGEILPPPSPENEIIDADSLSEQPSEETPTKSKKKKKSKKPKKLSVAELRAKREAWVNVGVDNTLKYVYSRGKMVGAEICVYAIRTLGNLCHNDTITAKRLGTVDDGVIAASGTAVIDTIFKVGTESPDDLLATMYEPLNSRWQEDILSQISAIKNARLSKMEKSFEEGSETNEDEAKRDILKSTLGEKHSAVSVKIEALDALGKFSESDVVWRKNASILAFRNAEEDASKAEIDSAAKNSEEFGLGVNICKLLHSYVKQINKILEGKDEKCNTRSTGIPLTVLEKTCSILSGLIRASGGRRAILDVFGYKDPQIISSEEEKEETSKVGFKLSSDTENRSAELSLLGGILSIIKGNGGESITLKQRLSAIRTLKVLCKDENIEDAKQTLEADMICQQAIRSGVLVQLISLLNYKRVLIKDETYDENFIRMFKREICELIEYMVSRGNCREGYYIKPGEEPRKIELQTEERVESVAAEDNENKSRPSSGKSTGKKSRPNSGKNSRPSSKKGKKEKKKGKKAKKVEVEQPPTVQVIGLDPNSGPTKDQWATVLNTVVNVEEYEHNLRTPLHVAVVGEHQAQISQLLAANVDVNISDAQNISPLHSALAQGLDKIVNDLLFIGGSHVDAVTTWGDSILKYAFVSPSSRKLRSLLQYHKEEHPNEEMEAVEGNARFVKTLLEQNADVTTCDADGNYAAHWVINGTSITYRMEGENVTLSNKSAYYGPDSNYQERITALINFGFADRVNGCNKFGQSPLHLALARGMTDVGALLLHKGANPNIVDGNGNLPLHVASLGWAFHSGELVKEMLTIGDGKPLLQGTLNSADVARGLSKLEREVLDVENYVLSSYMDIVVSPPSILNKQMPKASLLALKNALGFTPMHYVCGGNTESSEPLGVPLGGCPYKGCEMQKPIDNEEELHKREAILSSRKELLGVFLQNGGNTNVIGLNGIRPLHCVTNSSADWHGHLDEEIVDILLQNGANLNHVDSQGRIGGGGSRFSPLHYAIQAKQFTLSWYLINRGAKIHPATCNPPLLHLACEHGSGADMVGYILAHGENANIRGEGIHKGHRKYCGTALQLACVSGNDQIVYGLLSHKEYAVDVNAVRPHNGRTALHLASFHGNLTCVKYLIEDGGADYSILCLENETALFSAIRGGNADIVAYLLKKCQTALVIGSTGANAIFIAERLNLDDPSKKSHAAVIELLLQSLSDEQFSQLEHLHECFNNRKSLKAYEDEIAAKAAEVAALAEEQRKVEELEVARSMVEAIFEIADVDGVGHLSASALNSLHEKIGAGIDFHGELYAEISEAIGASAKKGWNGDDLLNAYLGDHHCFDLDRDHKLLFPPLVDDNASVL